MMRMKTKPTGLPHMNGGSIPRGGGGEAASEWEVRPGGMLVQKRNPDSDRSSIPPPTIRVRVKYGSTYHEMHINSQATFGELKKLLTGPTGLHHQDQKLLFKDKERDSKAYLDISGVKDKSKIVLVEDPISQEKRFLERRKNANMEKASKSISEISLQVDSLAAQVSALESIISKGGKVVEKDVLNLIELLMNQLLKLDGIMADGDVKLQRKMQVKRVQKYVETLDVLKMKNSMPPNTQNQQKQSNGQKPPRHFNGHRLVTIEEEQPRRSVGNLLDYNQHHHHQQQQQQASKQSAPGAAFVVTTQWETFDSNPVPSTSTSTSTNQNNRSNIQNHHQPSFPWDLLS
ncbi:BAG family molecular chaperone regulator 1 [Euphorbia lathyris]|uniref:BAG family molecular chaperone regulator 1 n=1 Tax=Euphorbia lathyris TaxID=212925 RepID=UPI003313993D